MMVTYADIQAELNNFISQGKLVEYKVVEDRGDKVVLNLVFKNDNDVIYSRNYVIAIYGRGTANEQAFWVGSKPTELYGQFKLTSSIVDVVKDKVVSDLQTNYNMVIIESVVPNTQNMTVKVDGYVKDATDQSKLIKKSYLAKVNSDGTYQIFEVAI